MNPFGKPRKHVIGLICLVLLTGMMGPSAWAQTDPPATPPPESKRFVSIDFNDVDINVFIKFISELTHTNFVVDDRVKGKVTILSPTKISVAEAYRVFESVLEVHGYTTVKSGKIIKIVPAPDARSKSIETLLRQESGTPEDRVITQLISLRYADANEIKRLFAPLVSKSSVVLAYPPTNILIVTDVYSNILRLLRILEAIDITGIGQELSLIPLEHADAAGLVKILDAVFKKARKAKKGEPEPALRFVADERTNTLIILASEDQTVKVKSLIAMLDKEVPRGEGKIRVYYLEYAVAEDLAQTLQAIPGKETKADKGGKKEVPVVSDKVKITADKATNSLIISAGKDDYLILEEIIQKLDIPRSMVYIEALIMEVNVDKNFSIGTEWQAAVSDNNVLGAGAFRVSEGTLDALSPVTGFSLGIFSEAVRIGGISFPNIQAIVHAYKKDQDVNILSTPQILTTDNEEASITVGKNVPFQTQTSQSDSGTAYNSFEYKDVGKTLKITPQINKDRLVRLNISLEVTALDTEFTNEQDRPTTLKRAVETTVIVKDTSTVVIGGLIDDTFSATENKVPCLGDVPLMRMAFRSNVTSNSKTNLYVFLTPHVIESPAEAGDIYQRKRDQIEKLQEGHIKMYKRQSGDSGPGVSEPLILE